MPDWTLMTVLVTMSVLRLPRGGQAGRAPCRPGRPDDADGHSGGDAYCGQSQDEPDDG